MFGDDIAAYLPEHIRPFQKLLKDFPENYEKWVHSTSVPNELYQGDVLDSATIVNVDDQGEVVRAEIPVMVISCTCDVQPGQGETLLIAAVYDFEDYKKNHPLTDFELEDHLRALQRNEIANLFYLPSGQKLKASVVDFQLISPVSVSYFYPDRFRNRLTSLSQVGHYFFLMKLAHHMARPESKDAERGQPQ
jgi:hypothetical protein